MMVIDGRSRLIMIVLDGGCRQCIVSVGTINKVNELEIITTVIDGRSRQNNDGNLW